MLFPTIFQLARLAFFRYKMCISFVSVIRRQALEHCSMGKLSHKFQSYIQKIVLLFFVLIVET